MAPPTPLLDRRLLFVSGKGGVGRSTVAAALALSAAEQGKRVLVCEVDAKGNLADFYETSPLRFAEREVSPGLWAMAMDTEASLKQYLSLQMKVPLVARIGPIARMFEFIAVAGPGVKEIVTIGKFCWEVKERHYDLVVVDASPTGHIIGQLASPQAINELVQVGLIRSQTQWMLDILGDPARTGLVIVATPEEMPVAETIELSHRVRAETNVELAAVVVNRVLPELFGRGEEQVFDHLAAQPDRLCEAIGGDAGPLLSAAGLAVRLRRTRAVHLDHLRKGIDPSVPLLYVPYLFLKDHGLRATRVVAEALAEELGT